MTRDDIIRMAQEAGFMTLCINEDTWIPYLSRFAKLVAAAEREECAKLCEMVEDDDLYFGSQYAFAIRERGAP
jgi:hypothetical protein